MTNASRSQALDEATRIARMVGDVSCLSACRRYAPHAPYARLYITIGLVLMLHFSPVSRDASTRSHRTRGALTKTRGRRNRAAKPAQRHNRRMTYCGMLRGRGKR